MATLGWSQRWPSCGVLERAPTSSGEGLCAYLLNSVQWLHGGSLRSLSSAIVGVYISWKLANATRYFFFPFREPIVTYLPAPHCGHPCRWVCWVCIFTAAAPHLLPTMRLSCLPCSRGLHPEFSIFLHNFFVFQGPLWRKLPTPDLHLEGKPHQNCLWRGERESQLCARRQGGWIYGGERLRWAREGKSSFWEVGDMNPLCGRQPAPSYTVS